MRRPHLDMLKPDLARLSLIGQLNTFLQCAHNTEEGLPNTVYEEMRKYLTIYEEAVSNK